MNTKDKDFGVALIGVGLFVFGIGVALFVDAIGGAQVIGLGVIAYKLA